MDFYANSLEHVLAETERVDLMIRFQVARSRRLKAADEQFQGLYVSEEQLDEMLARPVGAPLWTLDMGGDARRRLLEGLDRLERQIEAAVAESLKRGIALRLHSLRQHYGLVNFDGDCLL